MKKNILNTLMLIMLICIIVSSCNKENLIKLAPVGSVTINLTTEKKVDGPKPAPGNNTSSEEISKRMKGLPSEFTATIKVMVKGEAERVTLSTSTFQTDHHQLSCPIEVPLDKPFTITVIADLDTVLWRGESNEVVLQENMLPYTITIVMEGGNYYIGDYYQGGIIFYVTGTYPNQSGLICAPADQSNGISWTNGGDVVAIGTTGEAVGTGQANTNAIVNALGAGSYAAKLCDDLDLNGYTDWFLPSRDELGLIYTNLKLKGLGGFTESMYWSSSIPDNDPNSAWIYESNGNLNGHQLIDVLSLRAIRAFGTVKILPSLTTLALATYSTTTATMFMTITSDGGSAITEAGVCWSTNPNPTVADSKSNDITGLIHWGQSEMTGLSPNTTYYVKSYLTNSIGTFYGNERIIKTLDVTQIIDVDLNIYNTVTIGTQVWTVENLRTSRYHDYTTITEVTDNATWSSLTTEAMCSYNNDNANIETYGRLYNYYAVVDGRGLCPTGWHIPTEVEWNTLITFLGGTAVAGGYMKEVGTTHWTSPNTGADNSSGFTGLPASHLSFIGSFGTLGLEGYGWSCTPNDPTHAWLCRFRYDGADAVIQGDNMISGYSVRCVKDDIQSVVTTTAITNITANSATTGGYVATEGSTPVTARGVCWNTAGSPTLSDSFTIDGTGFGPFISNITGLTSATGYWVRAYATNSSGTYYGQEVWLFTL